MIQEYELGANSILWAIPLPGSRQTAMLPFAVRSLGHFRCDPTYYTRREGLEECLLLYTLSGSGIIKYAGTESLLLPGEVFLINCRFPHYYATHDNHWDFLWFHFYGKCAFDYVDLLNAENPAPLPLEGRLRFPACFEKLVTQAKDLDSQSELQISLVIQELLTNMISLKRSQFCSVQYGTSQPQLEKSVLFLQKHFQDPITIEQAAEICHLSKYHFIKLFKSYTGQTPYDYLLSYRLQQAQKLLLETADSVNAIALQTGFSEVKNFIACFKKKVGQTPLQYRKANHLYPF